MPPGPVTTNAHSKRNRCRDRALLIAMSYEHHRHKDVSVLETTHGDLERFDAHLVKQWGYLRQNIVHMRDGHPDARLRPTRMNILREIDILVRDVGVGDRRVFYLAGHCYQVVSHSGTELDHLDEVVLTDQHHGPPLMKRNPSGTNKYFDFKALPPNHPDQRIKEGIIFDNEFRKMLVDRVPGGARLVVVCDTCHSGTLCDLDFHWIREGSQLKTLSLPRPKKRRATHKAVTQRRDALMSPRGSRDTLIMLGSHEPRQSRGMTVGPVAMIAKENETWFEGERRCSSPPPVGPDPEVYFIASSQEEQSTYSSGVSTMTTNLCNILGSTHGITYGQLTKRLDDELKMFRMRRAQDLLIEASEKRRARMLKDIARVQAPVIGGLSRNTPTKLVSL